MYKSTFEYHIFVVEGVQFASCQTVPLYCGKTYDMISNKRSLSYPDISSCLRLSYQVQEKTEQISLKQTSVRDLAALRDWKSADNEGNTCQDDPEIWHFSCVVLQLCDWFRWWSWQPLFAPELRWSQYHVHISEQTVDVLWPSYL